MAADLEGLKQWSALRAEWQAAHQNALEARAGLVVKQVACAAGRGPDPTVSQIDYVLRLEAVATQLSIEMDNFVKNKLG